MRRVVCVSTRYYVCLYLYLTVRTSPLAVVQVGARQQFQTGRGHDSVRVPDDHFDVRQEDARNCPVTSRSAAGPKARLPKNTSPAGRWLTERKLPHPPTVTCNSPRNCKHRPATEASGRINATRLVVGAHLSSPVLDRCLSSQTTTLGRKYRHVPALKIVDSPARSAQRMGTITESVSQTWKWEIGRMASWHARPLSPCRDHQSESSTSFLGNGQLKCTQVPAGKNTAL